MEETYLDSEHKYAYKNQTIILPVIIKGLPEFINVSGVKLQRRSSFHVSLVCLGKIIEKYQIVIDNFQDLVINEFKEFIKNYDFKFLNYHQDFRFVKEDEKKSVIVMCELTNLSKFFQLLNDKYHLDIEVQPTHITLYTLQPDKGIFITDTNDLHKLSEQITPPFILDLKL